jgi:hypothetical protein
MKMKEKNRVIGVGICVVLLLAIIPVTGLAVPSVVNYQGYLTDAEGNPLNGEVAITFRIWSAEVAGTEVWSESHAAVAVSAGVFNVLLGSSVPISAGMLEGDRWLGMAVGTDVEMTPRMKVTSVVYAIRAGYAEAVIAGAVTTSALSDTAVTEAKIASGAVTGAKVATGTLTASHLQNGAAITEILDNDGAGSGLNADLLDNYDSSAFSLSGHTHTGVYADMSHNHDTAYLNATGDSMGSASAGAVLTVENTGLGKGVYSYATSGAGVEGRNSTNNNTGRLGTSEAGGYFSGGADHNDIILGGSVGRINTDPAVQNSSLYLASNNEIIIKLDNDGGEDSVLRVKNSGGNDVVTVDEAGNAVMTGNVGVGITSPQEKLHVEGNIRIPSNSHIINSDGRAVFHTGWSGVFGDYSVINSGYDWGSGEPVSVVAGSNGVFFTKGDASGTPYAETMGSIDTNGRFSTKSLQITGGSDIAEPFDIRKADAIKPGMLMVIDPDHPGLLRVSDHAYDTRVAGVVSGAGGINPGMILTQESSTINGSTLIALSGRIYCLADATRGAIQPGDMLTTSDMPGLAMKAKDRERSFGAVIGKAMTPLDKGTGLVLVLVNLQ